MFLTLLCKESQLEIAHGFYQRLGCEFVPEQHGEKGLRHFSVVFPQFPVELYPLIKGLPSEELFFIGVAVQSPETVKIDLIKNFEGSEPQPSIPTTKTGIATLRDPNGNLVRLFPQP